MITNYKMDHAQYIIAYYLVMVTLSTSLMVLCVVLFLICKKKPIDSVETLPVKLCAQAYSLIDIDAATDGFNNRRIVGKGFGFSSVLKCLSSVQHPNIVPIIGFSEAPGERIIVMELVRMVSLDFYLHQNVNGASLLDWNKRIRIVAGACKGLQYLHEMVAPSIVHGCVKSSNILIDVNFCARISDYGLNFLAPFEKRGLEGYVDYEYWNGSGASKESDVYGLGVVILEILSGRGCEEGLLEKWALPLIKEMCFSELLDPRLVIPSNMKPLVRLAKVASACVGNSRKCRPSMAQVATILNNLEMEMCM
ncbi:PREDICTED: serine/threonine-protein kinase-like protein ACR4 isoform X2 [Lupinus angustifolius]|uniref:serine/threonine-protein kinase-like protein ACR4 isoform X2 n=1 Tax=Lupinus angustifolius TaxID=3871 RepID=UPI00092F5FCC|nr:PREDICTED: serine/threonine-protein kinase-like protein ACR4 isoform X2 [Lupinus angustifolius]